jgi:hypothetical protein
VSDGGSKKKNKKKTKILPPLSAVHTNFKYKCTTQMRFLKEFTKKGMLVKHQQQN